MKLAITQYRSAIGRGHIQQDTLKALGIRKLHQRVVHEDSPQIRGMINRVTHLVAVEQVQE